MLAETLSGMLQLACAILLLSSGAAVWALWKGCRVLRRLALVNTRDDSPILLKSPRVPAVSVIAVARDASAEARAFAHRLLELHFGHHEVVLVLEGLTPDDMETWTREFRLVPSHRSAAVELAVGPVKAA